MSSLYDHWMDSHVGTWSAYENANGRPGTMVMDTFTNDVYSEAWMVLLGVTMLTCFLYYFYFNRRFGNYYSLGRYAIFWVINLIVVAALTFLLAYLAVHTIPAPTRGPIFWLTIINVIYAFGGFFLLSVVCQLVAILFRRFLAIDFSHMGNRTPF